MSINLNFIDINKSAKEANYPSETPTNLVSVKGQEDFSSILQNIQHCFARLWSYFLPQFFFSFEWARKLIFHSQNKLCRIQSTVSFLLEKSYVIVSQICVTYDVSQNKLE